MKEMMGTKKSGPYKNYLKMYDKNALLRTRSGTYREFPIRAYLTTSRSGANHTSGIPNLISARVELFYIFSYIHSIIIPQEKHNRYIYVKNFIVINKKL